MESLQSCIACAHKHITSMYHFEIFDRIYVGHDSIFQSSSLYFLLIQLHKSKGKVFKDLCNPSHVQQSHYRTASVFAMTAEKYIFEVFKVSASSFLKCVIIPSDRMYNVHTYTLLCHSCRNTTQSLRCPCGVLQLQYTQLGYSHVQSWALTVVLNFHIMKKTFLAFLSSSFDCGQVISISLVQKWLIFIARLGLEATFGTTLQNRKSQMPSSGYNHLLLLEKLFRFRFAWQNVVLQTVFVNPPGCAIHVHVNQCASKPTARTLSCKFGRGSEATRQPG